MTNRQLYFVLLKKNNRFLNERVIKNLLLYLNNFENDLTLFAHFDDEVQNSNKIDLFVKQLSDGFPIQYLTGRAHFFNKNYYVNQDVLIPRPETEELVIKSINLIKRIFNSKSKLKILDVGTGSGVIADSLKRTFTDADVVGIDISDRALEVAKFNTKGTVHLKQMDILDDNSNFNHSFDVIISNPPYIEDESEIDYQVFKYEPRQALIAQPCEKYYQNIIKRFLHQKNPTLFCFEIGETTEECLTSLINILLPNSQFYFEKDLYNKTRFLFIIMNG